MSSKENYSPEIDIKVNAEKGSSIKDVSLNVQIGKLTNTAFANEQPKVHIPQTRNLHFIGRKQELDAIDQAFSQGNQVAIQALSGLGGIGKTATALEYAYRYREKHPDKHIFWITADNSTNIVKSFRNIARKLNFSLDQKTEEIIASVKNWLEERSNWLLVFDNLEDLRTLTGYLPTPTDGNVLITTRLASIELYRKIVIETLNEVDGVELLLKCAGTKQQADSERQIAGKLVKELGGLPLAIEQAGAYIVESQSSLQEYLPLYQKNKKQLLAKSNQRSDHDTVTLTFQLSFENLAKTNSVAADLLRFISFLAPDAIPEEIFILNGKDFIENLQLVAQIEGYWEQIEELEKTNPDQAAALRNEIPQETVNQVISFIDQVLNNELRAKLQPLQMAAVDNLQWNEVRSAASRYSLIKRDTTTKSFSIHRLVQLVIREMMNKEEQHQWLGNVVETLARVGKAINLNKVENWPLCARLFPHQQALFEHIKEYQLVNEASGALLNYAGCYARLQGWYNEAESLLKGALDINEQVLGTSPFDYVTSLSNYVISLSNLAALYYSRGQYREAEPLLKEVVEVFEQALGTNHPYYAISLSNLANIYNSQGRYSEAERLLNEALRRMPGAQHSHYAIVLNNLAELYHSQWQYSKAEPLCREALSITKEVLGTQNPNYAKNLSNLASLYMAQGRYREAERLFKKVLDIQRQVLGKQHPDYAQTLSNLASSYKAQGRYREAEPLFKEALDIQRQALGAQHPNYAQMLSNLAEIYYEQNQYDQAELLLKEAFDITKQVLGKQHPNYAQRLNDLASLYKSQERYHEAELLYKEALDIQRQALGAQHPNYAIILSNLADLYARQNNLKVAIPLLKKALHIQIKCLLQDHPNINAGFESLIEMLIAVGQLQRDKAEAYKPQLLQEILQMEIDE